MEHVGIWHDSDATASCGGALRCSDTPAGSVISQYTHVPAATAPEWPVCQWLPRRADGCAQRPASDARVAAGCGGPGGALGPFAHVTPFWEAQPPRTRGGSTRRG